MVWCISKLRKKYLFILFCAIFPGKIIVSGGYPATTDTEIYDIASNTWSAGLALPGARWSGANGMLGFNSIAYAGGANQNGLLDEIIEYRWVSGTWVMAETLKKPTQSMAVITVPNGTFMC